MEQDKGVSFAQSEFDFTTIKIEENFSNFSAWHHRAQMIMKMVKGPFSDDEAEALLTEELDRIRQAVYTDPNDQSPWIYQGWLLGVYSGSIANRCPLIPRSKEAHLQRLNEEIQHVQELLDLEPESRCKEIAA